MSTGQSQLWGGQVRVGAQYSGRLDASGLPLSLE